VDSRTFVIVSAGMVFSRCYRRALQKNPRWIYKRVVCDTLLLKGTLDIIRVDNYITNNHVIEISLV